MAIQLVPFCDNCGEPGPDYNARMNRQSDIKRDIEKLGWSTAAKTTQIYCPKPECKKKGEDNRQQRPWQNR